MEDSDPPLPRRSPRATTVAMLVALVFGLWGAWQAFATDDARTRAELSQARETSKVQERELELLRQRVATLERSDQISRDANRDLQTTLSERDEEIAGLRADVAFYERLVGATSQRRGLSVHALRVQPQQGGAWRFTSTLTQNLNRGAVSSGRLQLSVEGSRDGRLQRLGWVELRQQPDEAGVDYSFRYFQQVEGDIYLPAGFTPVRVTARLEPRSGPPVEQSFTWAEATREAAPGS